MSFLVEKDVDIRLRLGKQIVDDYLHYQYVSRLQKDRGGDNTIENYQTSEGQLQFYRDTYNFSDLIEIAASFVGHRGGCFDDYSAVLGDLRGRGKSKANKNER